MTLSNLPENNATITVAIFPSEQISKYGKVIGQTRVYCDDKGEFISDVEEDELFIFSVNKSAKIEGSFNNINSTSIYNVIIAFCDLKDQLVIEKGTLTFLNAHGYLPASRYKLLTVCVFFLIYDFKVVNPSFSSLEYPYSFISYWQLVLVFLCSSTENNSSNCSMVSLLSSS